MSYCLNPHCPAPQNPAPQNEVEVCQSCGMRLWLWPSLPDGKTRRYVALKPLGSGGFGRTFVAIQQVDSERSPCVIKQFFPQSKNPESRARAIELFQQEAEQLRQLGEHPQIPELLDNLEQDGHLYLIQEFIDGRNLSDELEEDGIFGEQKIRQLLLELLPVLQFLHDHQVIHRDIKPANIIRPKSYAGNRPPLVLVDLGAAKQATQLDQVLTGTIIGSAEFTAPEQARGKATFASDLYSLGSTCIYLLTHVSPFDLYDTGEGHWVWRDYLEQPISKELDQILDKLLQPATRRRYQTANEVLLDLGVSWKKISSRRFVSRTATIGSNHEPTLPDFTLNSKSTSVDVGLPSSIPSPSSGQEVEIGILELPQILDVKPIGEAAIAPTSRATTQPAEISQPAPGKASRRDISKNLPLVTGLLIFLVLLATLSKTVRLDPVSEVPQPQVELGAAADDSIKTILNAVQSTDRVALDEAGKVLTFTQTSNPTANRTAQPTEEVTLLDLSTGTPEPFPQMTNLAQKEWWYPNEAQNFSFPVVYEDNNQLWLKDVLGDENLSVPIPNTSASNHRFNLSDNNRFLMVQPRTAPEQVSVYEIETGEQIGSFSAPVNRVTDPTNQGASYRRYALSPDGKSVAIARYTEASVGRRTTDPVVTAIEIRDTRNNNLLGTIRTAPSESIPSNYFFSPSGRTLVVQTNDNLLEVWSVEDEALLSTLTPASRSETRFVFSPAQEQIIAISEEEGLQVWDVTDTALKLYRAIPNVPAWSNFAISPDGYTLAWTTPSQVNPGYLSINITDLRSTTLLRTLEGLPRDPARLLFTKNGDRLVSISASGTIKLWQIFR